MSLRINEQDGSIILTLPSHMAAARGLDFAMSKADWLTERLDALPDGMPFKDGAILPLLGVPHRLRHDPLGRQGVWLADREIHVAGRPEHFERRLTDWLKREARKEITALALPMAASIGKSPGSVRLKDTRSRWGSCSARGDLAFSWRLVLAPAHVLAYVVAHEVAHLAQMNHSPAFWRVVDELIPDAGGARAWLKRNGTQLHRYGRS
ncbi:zinc metallopeptidase [Telmatospirillum siberiense]|uniref:Zinc metallopeptidase n=2 Tax=Telmatospirillum siberiense TaxID=382514 RepID=A0A2N3PSL7_9PROT|nr:zinc metallopeptidase [Telmatospirillum siberiense]